MTEALDQVGQRTWVPVMSDLSDCSPPSIVQHTTSLAQDIAYNCVAWAVKDTDRWWWPDEDSYWPEGIARDESIAAFVEAFRDAGFLPCDDSHLEEGCEKIAIYSLRTTFQPTSRDNSSPASGPVNLVNCRTFNTD